MHVAGDLNPTVFHEQWWLEASCGDDYKEVTLDDGGRVVGRMPYTQTTFMRQLILRMPPLTRVLGPAVSALGKGASRITRELELTSQLITRLPRSAHIHMRLHWGVQHTLAFKTAGFQTGVDYTVRIDPVPSDVLWKQMRDKSRNVIRRAQEKLQIVETEDVESFVSFYDKNIKERGERNSYDLTMLKKTICKCLEMRRGRILALVDSQNNMKAALFTVWDANSEYYLMSTRQHNSDNGSMNLLLWHSIKQAHACSRVFDMSGLHTLQSSIPNLLIATSFGGCITPNYYVYKTTALLQVASLARNLICKRI